MTSIKKRSHDEVVKILMIGESGVGKSSILTQFVENKFTPNFITTLGVEYKQKLYSYDEKNVLLQIWDTAGQEKFRTITPVYYRKVDAVVMVFDLSDEHSFQSVDYWMKNLEDYAHQSIKVILVGNKSDMIDKMVITKEAGEAMAAKYKIKYIETSAKTKVNVSEAFLSVTKDVLDNKKLAQNQSEVSSPMYANTTVDPAEINTSVHLKKDQFKKNQDNKCLARCC